MLQVYTKDELIEKLNNVRNMGWIENTRPGNAGAVGNILEDVLEIPENNLAIANSGEWELKSRRRSSTALTTLLHSEPSPRNARLVPSLLLPCYGWAHQKAGTEHPDTEMSFRQTINCKSHSDRGFIVRIHKKESRIEVSFKASEVQEHHRDWLDSVIERVGHSGELDPVPYWGIRDLAARLGTKLLNCFFVSADVKREGHKEYYKYDEILMLEKFSMDGFLKALQDGLVYVDFDARTGHNHGTKFRIRSSNVPLLYENVRSI